MRHPSGSPPVGRRRVAVIAGVTVAALVVSIAPALAHAQFEGSNATDPGSPGVPYPAASTQIITIVRADINALRSVSRCARAFNAASASGV